MDGSNITAFGKGNVITAEGFFVVYFLRQTLRHRNQLFNLGHLRTSSQAIGGGIIVRAPLAGCGNHMWHHRTQCD